VRLLLICSLLITILAAPALSVQAPASAPQDIAKMEQALKEAADLQSSRPDAVAEKLAPLFADLRPLRQSGTLTPAASQILQDALLLLMRTQSMLLLSEQEISASLRELLITNAKIDESLFNPREKLLLDKIRSAETGHYALETTPPGAVLSYLGAELGKTPSNVALIAGTYRFQLRLPGYLDQDFEVTIQPSEVVTAARTLRRRTVEIPVSINAPAATVIMNGQTLGVSRGYDDWLASIPADRQQEMASIIQQWNIDRATASFVRLLEVPVGEAVKIEFQAACHEPFTLQLTVTEQEVDWTHPVLVRPELRRVELKRDTGFMEVSSTPSGAEVWLDGSLQGQTPLGKDVCAGSHRIQVLHRSGQYLQEVNIRRGQASKVSGELKPAIAFLGIYAQNEPGTPPTPVRADWETVARRIALRSTAFVDPQITPDDIDALRKKGALPVEKLLQEGLAAADADMLIKRISAEVGRVDMLILGLRAENKCVFRLYSTIHPMPDVIEVPNLEQTSLDFLISQLNKAESIGTRLQVVDLGIEMMESPKGLVVLDVSPAVAAGKAALAPGVIVKTIDQKALSFKDLQNYLRSKKPGQSVTLEVQTSKEALTTVSIPVRLSGAEYPWSTPDGFANSVLTMLRHIVELDPLADEAKYASLSLARGLMNQKEWKLALELLAKTNLEPHKSGVCPGTVLYYQGRCYEELGDRAQAESYYTRAKDYAEATLGMPGGPAVPVLAEQRIQSLKKPNK
jgi:hypothetical protein